MKQKSKGVFLFTDEGRPSLKEVGGKAQSLILMIKENFNVPEGFVLSVNFFETWKKKSLKSLKFSKTQKKILQEAVEKLSNNNLFAVRSSSPEEDLEETSFAGLYETTLGVTEKKLESAIIKSYKSLFDKRVLEYKNQNNIKTDPQIAIIVQQQIPSDLSGVAFSANPLSFSTDEVVINSSFGLGETIVSGEVTPDLFIVEKNSRRILEKKISKKDYAIWLKKDGGTQKKRNDSPSKSSLTDKRVKEIAKLVVDVENYYQKPMDIEWAYYNNTLHLLQARPITNLGQIAEWKPKDPKAILARASIAELLPDPLTPLFASIALKPIVKGLEKLGEDLIKSDSFKDWEIKFPTLNGYGYYQMKIKLWPYIKMMPAIFRLLPWMFKRSILDWKDIKKPKFQKIIDKWAQKDVKKMNCQELLKGGATLTAKTMHYYTAIQAALPIIYMSEAVFLKFYNVFVKKEKDPPSQVYLMGYENMPLKSDKSLYEMAMSVSKNKRFKDFILKVDDNKIQNLLKRKIAPSGISKNSWEDWQESFKNHLKNFGHMIYDLDVAKSIPADSPEPLFATMKYFLSGKGDNPYERQKKMIKDRESSTKKIKKRLGFIRRYFFIKLLKFAQKKAPYREDSLADVGLAYPTARKFLNELAKRLVKKRVILKSEDMFFLKFKELEAIAKKVDAKKKIGSYKELVKDRKKLWEWQRSLTPPPVLPKNARVFGFKMERFLPAHEVEGDSNSIKGFAASSGKITGKASVILSPDQFGEMQEGDILVTAITTPAWTPLFAKASGIVTDIGGPLSHSSIVAREYGIPAVLGTGAASKMIKSGQQITVDGNKGIVKLD